MSVAVIALEDPPCLGPECSVGVLWWGRRLLFPPFYPFCYFVPVSKYHWIWFWSLLVQRFQTPSQIPNANMICLAHIVLLNFWVSCQHLKVKWFHFFLASDLNFVFSPAASSSQWMFSNFSFMVPFFLPQAKDLIITPATILKEKPDPSTLVFGTVFTDHMLTVEWSSEFGWEKPRIRPLQNLSLHPGSSAFHYAVEVSTWESMMVTS